MLNKLKIIEKKHSILGTKCKAKALGYCFQKIKDGDTKYYKLNKESIVTIKNDFDLATVIDFNDIYNKIVEPLEIINIDINNFDILNIKHWTKYFKDLTKEYDIVSNFIDEDKVFKFIIDNQHRIINKDKKYIFNMFLDYYNTDLEIHYKYKKVIDEIKNQFPLLLVELDNSNIDITNSNELISFIVNYVKNNSNILNDKDNFKLFKLLKSISKYYEYDVDNNLKFN